MSTVDLGLISIKNVDNAPLAGDVDETTINHDNLFNFVADEHIDHSSVVLSAGAGIDGTGLGDLTASRTIALTDTAVAPGSFGSASSSSSITVDQQGRITAASDTPIDHDALTNYEANEHIDWTNATQALSTSGNITASGSAVGQFGSVQIGSSGTRPLEISSTAATEARIKLNGVDAFRIFQVGGQTIVGSDATTVALGGSLLAFNISTPSTGTITASGTLRVTKAPVIQNGVLQSVDAFGLIGYTLVSATNMADNGVGSGTYGSSSVVPTLTVDSKGLVTTVTSTPIDHDALTNFVANEHVDHSSVVLSAGAGIDGTGLGDLTASRTIALTDTAVAPGGSFGTASATPAITVDAQGRITAAANTNIDHDALTNFVANEHVDHSAVVLSAGAGIDGTGLGDLTASRTIALTDTAVAPGGSFGTASATPAITVDAQGRITAATDTPIDHDALTNFVANEHIDWTAATNTFQTSVDSAAAFQVRTAGGANQLAVDTVAPNVSISAPLTYTGSTPVDGAMLMSDASGNATWMQHRMADIYWESNATTTSVLNGSFTKVQVGTGLTVLNPNSLGSWSLNAVENRLQYTGTRPGVMHGGCTLSLTGGNGKVFRAAIYKNGLIIPGSTVQFSTANATADTSTAIHFMTSVATNDFFELFVAGVGVTDTVTVPFANIFAVVMG